MLYKGDFIRKISMAMKKVFSKIINVLIVLVIDKIVLLILENHAYFCTIKTSAMRKYLFIWIYPLLLCVACASKPAEDRSVFVCVNNGQFMQGNKPYYFIGTNFWYGAILGSEGEGGNRERLHNELDFLQKMGVDNLRVLVGTDGERGRKNKVEPTLQCAPGVYNDTILAGLDYLMAELGKRKMTAVLYLNNSWEWSGGYSAYLEWTGHGKAVTPSVDAWTAYTKYVQQFIQSDSAKQLFASYVKDIVMRVNRYTKIKYVDDPAILSWQIGNEPRAFSDENKELFASWMSEVAALIKSLDRNHLVSSGSEGEKGCENDLKLYEKIHADNNIDYLTIHIWPYNWKWIKQDSIAELVVAAKENTGLYISKHLELAQKYNKPMVIEEFGFPRDGFSFDKKSSTVNRNEYYNYIFDLVRQSHDENGLLAGCNFWAWGGFAKQVGHIFWEKGDDYVGDPVQEEQGLNSVFATDDETCRLIENTIKKMK